MARRSILRRAAALAGFATLVVQSHAAPQDVSARPVRGGTAPSACVAPAGMLTLNFALEFAGVSQTDHASDVWTGRVGDPFNGALVMTLELLGNPLEAANPVWKVRTRWMLTPESTAALGAELYGTINWKTGTMRLSGTVTEGCLAGAEVHADGRFLDLDGSGTLQIIAPTPLSRADVKAQNP